jgi:hypothetical protein
LKFNTNFSMRKMTRIISFSGIDGCGKTTIINAVRENLEIKGYKIFSVWLRYNHYLTRFLHAYCRISGFTRYEHFGDLRIGYHEFHRSKIISFLEVALTFIDTYFATLILVYVPWLLGQRIIICDRWIPDILIDLSVDTRWEVDKSHLWVRLFWKLVPKHAKCFIISRNTASLEKARPEHIYDMNYEIRLQLFKEFPKFSNIIHIENNMEISEAVQQVFKHLD